MRKALLIVTSPNSSLAPVRHVPQSKLVIASTITTTDSNPTHNAGASQDSTDCCPDGPYNPLAPVAPLCSR
jgi:hypothetical protein